MLVLAVLMNKTTWNSIIINDPKAVVATQMILPDCYRLEVDRHLFLWFLLLTIPQNHLLFKADLMNFFYVGGCFYGDWKSRQH